MKKNTMFQEKMEKKEQYKMQMYQIKKDYRTQYEPWNPSNISDDPLQ